MAWKRIGCLGYIKKTSFSRILTRRRQPDTATPGFEVASFPYVQYACFCFQHCTPQFILNFPGNRFTISLLLNLDRKWSPGWQFASDLWSWMAGNTPQGGICRSDRLLLLFYQENGFRRNHPSILSKPQPPVPKMTARTVGRYQVLILNIAL